MRLLLDEHLRIGLFCGTPWSWRGYGFPVAGWSGIENGEPLRRMSGQYDVLVTMDRIIEFQQRISALPFGIVLVRPRPNRMQDLRPLVRSILSALDGVNPGRGRIQEVGS
jgi:hypothetical protein